MCAPEPVTMMSSRVLVKNHASSQPPFTVPSFALKLLFGEGAQPILDSIRMKSEVLEAIGFTYTYEDLCELFSICIKIALRYRCHQYSNARLLPSFCSALWIVPLHH